MPSRARKNARKITFNSNEPIPSSSSAISAPPTPASSPVPATAPALPIVASTEYTEQPPIDVSTTESSHAIVGTSSVATVGLGLGLGGGLGLGVLPLQVPSTSLGLAIANSGSVRHDRLVDVDTPLMNATIALPDEDEVSAVADASVEPSTSNAMIDTKADIVSPSSSSLLDADDDELENAGMQRTYTQQIQVQEVQHLTSQNEHEHNYSHNYDDAYYRSPPFREVTLPPRDSEGEAEVYDHGLSVMPLPVLPRDRHGYGDDDLGEGRFGHGRAHSVDEMPMDSANYDNDERYPRYQSSRARRQDQQQQQQQPGQNRAEHQHHQRHFSSPDPSLSGHLQQQQQQQVYPPTPFSPPVPSGIPPPHHAPPSSSSPPYSAHPHPYSYPSPSLTTPSRNSNTPYTSATATTARPLSDAALSPAAPLSPLSLTSLTRTLRGYVPSAPPVSLGMVVGSGASGAGGYEGRHVQEFEREYEREEQDGGYEYRYGYGRGHAAVSAVPPQTPAQTQRQTQPHQPQEGRVSSGSGLAQAMAKRRGGALSASAASSTSTTGGAGAVVREEEGSAGGGGVVWARWDWMNVNLNLNLNVGDAGGGGSASARRVLLIAYSHPSSLQMWDCADLGSIREVFNIRFDTPEWDLLLLGGDSEEGRGAKVGSGVVGTQERSGGGRIHLSKGKMVRIVQAALLPDPSRLALSVVQEDPYVNSRPVLAILMDADSDAVNLDRESESKSTFVLYSLRTHEVLKLRVLPGLSAGFQANEHVVVVSTATPPTLRILCATSFDTLYTLSSAHLELEAFSHEYQHQQKSSSISSLSISNALSIPSSIARPSTSYNNQNYAANTNTSFHSHKSLLSTSGLSIEHAHSTAHDTTRAYPVFTLSHRLLAYASPSPSSLISSKSKSASSPSAPGSASSASTGGPPSGPPSLSSSPFVGLGKLAAGLNLGNVGMGLNSMGGITQADVGHAALRVGESVLGGMRFLGGMALEAAKNRVGGGETTGGIRRPLSVDSPIAPSRGSGGGSTRFVSRSAPGDSGWDQRVAAPSSSYQQQQQQHRTTVAPQTQPVAEHGHYITVLDLGPLLSSISRRKEHAKDKGDKGKELEKGKPMPPPLSHPNGARPRKIAEFNASRSQPVVGLQFAKDGTSIAVILRDGHSVKVFKLRPMPSVLLASRGLLSGAASPSGANTPRSLVRDEESEEHDGRVGPLGSEEMEKGAAMQMYDLYRGLTSALIEGVEWAVDGRWVGVGTRNRTLHVFAVNPYGSKPDLRSHLEGRVRNVEFIDPPATSLNSLIRIKGSKTPSEYSHAPLAFTFISPSDVSSPNLLPPLSPQPFVGKVPSSPTFSPPQMKRGTNYQDVLLFDPADGVLSLRRLTLDKHAVKEQGGMPGVAVSAAQALGVTSISLPGMGGAGKLSSSPSSVNTRMGNISKANFVADPPMDLGAKESVVATWDLRRGRGWKEIRNPVRFGGNASGKKRILLRDWLAEGELSTCSNSQKVLPKSIYLSHQFSFHTLGEDYHALIRKYQFDISGAKIEVRKEVEVSAYSSSHRDDAAFIQDLSSPRDIHGGHRPSSSFDEPLASALSGTIDSSTLPPILPMYPNGVAKSSFRNSIPIRRTMAGIGDGVTEGLGRIRREMQMHKARSPILGSREDQHNRVLSSEHDHANVPLEFDEEDEDFLLNRDDSNVHGDIDGSRTIPPTTYLHAPATTSRGPSTSGSSVVAPDSNMQQLLDADIVGTVDEEIWTGWDRQDKMAVEEEEQFLDFAAVGYMDLDAERERDLAAVEDQQHALMGHAQTLDVTSTSSSRRKGRPKRRA